MGRLSKQFIRFPKHCKVYDIGEPTPFSDGEKTLVWEGACRLESNTSIRSFTKSENVMMSDYRVQLGTTGGAADAAPDGKTGQECGAIVEGITSGMIVEVVGYGYELSVTDVYVGQLGTTVYCNVKKT